MKIKELIKEATETIKENNPFKKDHWKTEYLEVGKNDFLKIKVKTLK